MHIYDTHSNMWQQCGAYVVLTWHSHGVNVTYVTICSHVGDICFQMGTQILRFWELMFTSLATRQEGIMGISLTQIH
jgi:hypothetical protein